MKKIFTGFDYAATYKEAAAWIDAQGNAIKDAFVTATMVERYKAPSGSPKENGKWTVTVEYEKSN